MRNLPANGIVGRNSAVSVVNTSKLRRPIALPVDNIRARVVSYDSITTYRIVLGLVATSTILTAEVRSLRSAFYAEMTTYVSTTLYDHMRAYVRPVVSALADHLGATRASVSTLRTFITGVYTGVTPYLTPVGAALASLISGFYAGITTYSIMMGLRGTMATLAAHIAGTRTALTTRRTFVSGVYAGVTDYLMPLAAHIASIRRSLTAVCVRARQNATFGARGRGLGPVMSSVLAGPFSTAVGGVRGMPVAMSLRTVRLCEMMVNSRAGTF